jgi:hypothetical protein
MVVRVNNNPQSVYRVNFWHSSINLSGLVIFLRDKPHQKCIRLIVQGHYAMTARR